MKYVIIIQCCHSHTNDFLTMCHLFLEISVTTGGGAFLNYTTFK